MLIARVPRKTRTSTCNTMRLEKPGAKIFEDKASGSRAERPGLNKAMEILREGDTLVVWKLDGLDRSVKHLVDLVTNLAKQGIHFKSLTDAIDTGTPSVRFFFHSMASPAQMERELTVERTRTGLKWPANRAVKADESAR
jgi:DNA invertase Pin-like site-specific DNA recombinase